MNPNKESDSLLALWTVVADEYVRTQDSTFLKCMDEIKHAYDDLNKNHLERSTAAPQSRPPAVVVRVHWRKD